MNTVFATMLIFGLLVTIHEWGHFIIAKREGVDVQIFSIGFGPSLLKYQFRGTLYKICIIPLGGYVKMSGDDIQNRKNLKKGDFLSKTPWQRIKIALAGPIMNYILAYALLCLVFCVGLKSFSPIIGKIETNSLAQKSGLMPGDKILKLNETSIRSWRNLILYIRTHQDLSEIKISLLRNKKKIDTIIQKNNSNPLFLGISPSGESQIVRYSFHKSLVLSFTTIIKHSYLTGLMIIKLIGKKLSLKDSVTGPIGIIQMTNAQVKKGIIPLLHFMAFLSIALGFFNLLPIPMLDGGHVFFFLIEWILKKPLSIKIQNAIQTVGIVFLLTLTIFVFFNDLKRLKHVKNISQTQKVSQ